MARKKRQDPDDIDGKSAGAGEAPEAIIEHVFDGPLDDEAALEELIDLNHTRQQHMAAYERYKDLASEEKKEMDAASNAISLLIDRIDRQNNGDTTEQPVLRTLPGNAEATV
jgi:hypothetical protein